MKYQTSNFQYQIGTKFVDLVDIFWKLDIGDLTFSAS